MMAERGISAVAALLELRTVQMAIARITMVTSIAVAPAQNAQQQVVMSVNAVIRRPTFLPAPIAEPML
jgi:hypothetical protein